jgi:protease II
LTRDIATLKSGIQLASLLPHMWYLVCGRIFQRRLDSSTGNKLVLEDNDASRFVDVARTKDWRFITLNVNSKTSSEAGVVTTSVRCSEEHLWVFHW